MKQRLTLITGILLLIVLMSQTGCSDSTGKPQEAEYKIFTGKIDIPDSTIRQQKGNFAWTTSHPWKVPVKKLETEIPTLKGTTEEIAQKKLENDKKFSTIDMLFAGDAMDNIRTTPKELLNHTYVQYYKIGTSYIVCKVLWLDPRDTTYVGREWK